MFTLKLYDDARQRIVEAQGFTIYHYNSYATQITAHQKNATDDEAFFVGTPPDDCDLGNQYWYARAIIENGNGRTTEFITPLFPVPVPAQALQKAA